MFKKKNHKIFNLIIMIIISIIILIVPNFCNATEYIFLDNQILLAETDNKDSLQPNVIIYEQADTDYLPERDKEPDKVDDDSALFKNINDSVFTKLMKQNVAKWYTILRYIAIAVMLVFLLVLGIKLAISSVASEKAIYKRMLIDWFTSFFLLFFVHYFMIFILFLNENLLDVIKSFSTKTTSIGEIGLYETVRTRAYDGNLMIGLTGAILYMNLVWFTCKFVYIYAKRLILSVILTIIAPVIVLFDSIKKILSGRTKVLGKWMEEYALNTILQSVHALLYVVFVGIALNLTENSFFGIIISLIALNFMSKADKIFREIFKFSDGGGALANDNAESKMSDMIDSVKDVAILSAVAKQTNVGQGIKDVKNTVNENLAKPFILAASNLGFGDWLRKGDAKENAKISDYDKNIGTYKKERDTDKEDLEKIRKEYNDKKAGLTDPQKDVYKKKIDAAIVKLGNSQEKLDNERNEKLRYVTNRSFWKRVREVIDPDTYMEADDYIDKNGIRAVNKDKKGNIKRRVIKTKKEENKKTGKKEVTRSISTVFDSAKKDILGFSDDDREVLKEVKDFAKSEVMGFGGILLGMSAIADNPSLGFALLATGGSNMKKISSRKNPKLKISFSARMALSRLAREDAKVYKFKAFSTGAILNIDKQLRILAGTDPKIKNKYLRALLGADQDQDKLKNTIWNLDLLFLPGLTLTGFKGMAANALDMRNKVLEQGKKDWQEYERSVDVELIKSNTSNVASLFATGNNNIWEYIETSIINRNIEEVVKNREIRNYNIVKIVLPNGDVKYVRFGEDKYAMGMEEINIPVGANPDEIIKNKHLKLNIKNAIINAGLKMNVFDIMNLDFKNSETQKVLIEELKSEGLISQSNSSSEAFIKKILFGDNNTTSGVVGIQKEFAREDKDAIKVRLYKKIVCEYMQENGIIVLNKSDKENILKRYNAVLYENSPESNINSLLISMLAQSGKKDISELNAEDVLNFASHPEFKTEIEKFRQKVIGAHSNKDNEIIYNLFTQIISGKSADVLKNYKKEVSDNVKELETNIETQVNASFTSSTLTDAILLLTAPINKNNKEAVISSAYTASANNVETFKKELVKKLKDTTKGLVIQSNNQLNKIVEEAIKSVDSKVANEVIRAKVLNCLASSGISNVSILKTSPSDAMVKKFKTDAMKELRKLGLYPDKSSLIEGKKLLEIINNLEIDQKELDDVKIKPIDENEIVFKRINETLKQKLSTAVDSCTYTIEKKKEKLDEYIEENIINSLSNNNILDINLLKTSPLDSRVVAFRTDVINGLRFNGLNNTDSELDQIINSRIENIITRNNETKAITDAIDKYIKINYSGKYEDFKNDIENNAEARDIYEKEVLSDVKSVYSSSSDEKILNAIRFIKLANSQEKLESNISKKMNSVTPQVVEDRMVKEEQRKFVNLNYGGDFEAFKKDFNDPSKDVRKRYQEQVLNRVKDANSGDKTKEDEIDRVIELIKNDGEVSQDIKTESKTEAMTMPDVDEASAKALPYPEVKTIIKNTYISYIFSVPNSLGIGYDIEYCKKDASGKGKWKTDTKADLREDETIVVRIKDTSGYGPSLILKYPVPVSNVVEKLANYKKDESKNISDRVLEKMTTDETVFKNQLQKAQSSDSTRIENLFKQRELVGAGNRTTDSMFVITDMKRKLDIKDSKAIEMVSNTRNVFEQIIGHEPKAMEKADEIVRALLEQKMISDDLESIKISKDKKSKAKVKAAVKSEKETIYDKFIRKDEDGYECVDYIIEALNMKI